MVVVIENGITGRFVNLYIVPETTTYKQLKSAAEAAFDEDGFLVYGGKRLPETDEMSSGNRGVTADRLTFYGKPRTGLQTGGAKRSKSKRRQSPRSKKSSRGKRSRTPKRKASRRKH